MTKMRKTDYELIAKVFSEAKISLFDNAIDKGEVERTSSYIAKLLSMRLKVENTRFDIQKFLKACSI